MSHGPVRMNRPIALALAAFAAGSASLQACARLPPWSGTLAIVTCCAMVAALCVAGRVGEVRAQWACAALVVAAAGLFGFFHAAWRADLRLADALPPQWEERDLRIVGVVDDLPQNDESGARFAFAVERVLTRDAVVPSRL